MFQQMVCNSTTTHLRYASSCMKTTHNRFHSSKYRYGRATIVIVKCIQTWHPLVSTVGELAPLPSLQKINIVAADACIMSETNNKKVKIDDDNSTSRERKRKREKRKQKKKYKTRSGEDDEKAKKKNRSTKTEVTETQKDKHGNKNLDNQVKEFNDNDERNSAAEEEEAFPSLTADNAVISIKAMVASITDPSSAPIVVSFPGGFESPCSDVPSLPIEFHSYRRNPHSSRGIRLIGRDKKCTYISSNLGRGFDHRRTKTLVGVYNVQERTLLLHLAAEKGTVFPMQQYITANSHTGTANNEILSWDARRNELFEAFGSSKKLKYLKSAAANKVNISLVVGANDPSKLLESTVATKQPGTALQQELTVSTRSVSFLFHFQFSFVLVRISALLWGVQICRFLIFFCLLCFVLRTLILQSLIDPVEEALEESRRQLLPQFDKTAILPSAVYNVHSVAGEEAWNQIARVVDACISKGDDGWAVALVEGPRSTATMYSNNKTNQSDSIANAVNNWPSSLVTIVNSLKDETNVQDKKVKHRLRIILLLRHVMKFHACANKRQFISGTNEEAAKFFGIPKEVADRLLEIFATPMEHCADGRTGFAFTKQLKDKRTVHALLLYMMAHGETMMVSSMQPFLNDMELNLKLASKLLIEAGCTVRKNAEGNDISVALPVPLQFPRSKGTKAGGKR